MSDGPTAATRVLIANRGEIAVRLIRACCDLGLTSVAVYGDGDESALHVERAEEAYRLDSPNPRPYLDGAAVLSVAARARCGLIHPGYGFLSESAAFAGACGEARVTFVGPSPDAIAAMGDKITARRLAREVGVPLAAGSDGPLADAASGSSARRRRWMRPSPPHRPRGCGRSATARSTPSGTSTGHATSRSSSSETVSYTHLTLPTKRIV